MILFGNRVFAEVVKLRWAHPGFGWALIHYEWHLYKKRRHTDTEGRMPCEDGNEEWHDTSKGQGMPRIASNHQKLRREPCNNFFLRACEKEPTLDFRLLASRTVREYISVFLSHPLCGNLSWQPWETNAPVNRGHSFPLLPASYGSQGDLEFTP